MAEATQPKPSLVDEFVNVIKSSVDRLSTFKENCTGFSTEVKAQAKELEELIKKLAACIEQIEALQREYESFIQQLTLIQQNILMQIEQAKADAGTAGDTACNEKITKIRSEFETLLALINGLKIDTNTGMKAQLDALKDIITKLCDEGDGIVQKMTATKEKTKAKLNEMGGQIKKEKEVVNNQPQQRPAQQPSQPPTGGLVAQRAAAIERNISQGGMPAPSNPSRLQGGRRRRRRRKRKRTRKRGGWRYGKSLTSLKSRRTNRRVNPLSPSNKKSQSKKKSKSQGKGRRSETKKRGKR